MKSEFTDSVQDGDSTYAAPPLDPQLLPYLLKIESPIVIAGYSSFANIIPVETVLVKMHNYHFGIVTDWFRLLLALRRWCIITVPQALPWRSHHWLSWSVSAQHLC
jgi:hypothetical protein